MKTRQLTHSLIAAAVMAATPAVFAQATATNAVQAKPLCSSLNHPNAGKHADKSTGKAGEHSKSAVHQDCIADSAASGVGTTLSGSGAATAPSTGLSTTPSMTGSTTTQGSSIAGSSTDQNTSITGSSSTVSPTIDARGRSTVTIDSNTTTGNQAATTSATTTTGSQTSNQSGTASSSSTNGSAAATDKSKNGR